MDRTAAARIQQGSGYTNITLAIDPIATRATLEEGQTVGPLQELEFREVGIWAQFISGRHSRGYGPGQLLDLVALNGNNQRRMCPGPLNFHHAISVGNFVDEPVLLPLGTAAGNHRS